MYKINITVFMFCVSFILCDTVKGTYMNEQTDFRKSEKIEYIDNAILLIDGLQIDDNTDLISMVTWREFTMIHSANSLLSQTITLYDNRENTIIKSFKIDNKLHLVPLGFDDSSNVYFFEYISNKYWVYLTEENKLEKRTEIEANNANFHIDLICMYMHDSKFKGIKYKPLRDRILENIENSPKASECMNLIDIHDEKYRLFFYIGTEDLSNNKTLKRLRDNIPRNLFLIQKYYSFSTYYLNTYEIVSLKTFEGTILENKIEIENVKYGIYSQIVIKEQKPIYEGTYKKK